MSDKFKKIDKEYCLTDDSVNVYKYRLLSSGLQLDAFKSNPIGYYLHGSSEEHPREQGVLVRWDDFRQDGDKVYAKPCINLSHPRGQRTVDEVESGFLNAASAGKIVVLEASNAPDLKMDGQTRPTVTKWFPREISLVDIPGNYNALANLYDMEDNELNLADFAKNFDQNMSNTVTVTAAKILAALNLSDQAQEAEVLSAVNDLIDKADKADELAKDLSDKTTELDNFKKETEAKRVEDLIAKGKEEKKLTNELAETLKKDYSENPDGLESLIANIPAQVSVVEDLKTPNPEAVKYEGKTWDDLYKSDELEAVKTKFPDLFDRLYKEKFENVKD